MAPVVGSSCGGGLSTLTQHTLLLHYAKNASVIIMEKEEGFGGWAIVVLLL